jgi:hypothetical protein
MSSLHHGQQTSQNNAKLVDGRPMLAGDEVISEEEARRRREQLNRRPSYRMILKDLETVIDKPMKKELDETVPSGGAPSGSSVQSSSLSLINASEGNSPYGSPLSNGGAQTMLRSPNNSTSMQLITTSNQQRINNMIPPSALPPSSRMVTPSSNSLIGEMPSQPQPQLVSSGASPMLQVTAAAVAAAAAAANSLSLPITQDILSLKAAQQDAGLMGGFAQNNIPDWQTSLLSSYNSSNPNNSLSGPAMGLGNRQGSASLTSLSDNDNDGNRKRQVRLLKNREAAKECRRKKKEYVKCLENRVAVLENQNKALIEELKTLKELYCRKEKTELT